jgi:hypothetical protein
MRVPMRATPRLSCLASIVWARRRATRLLCAFSIATCAFGTGSCRTITTVSGRVDSSPGRVAGHFYYLPKGLFRVRGGYVDKEYTISVSATYIADPRRRYYLEPRHNPFYDGDYRLQINAKGLLDTVQVTAEDRTADILGDVANIASGSLKFAAGSGVGAFDLRDLAAQSLEPFDYTFDLGEAPEVRTRLAARGFKLDITAHDPEGARHAPFPFAARETGSRAMPHERVEAAGIVFRPARAYTVRITDLPLRRRLAEELQRQAAAAQAAAARAKTLPRAPAQLPAVDEADRQASALRRATEQTASASESLRIQTTVLLPDENTQLLFALGRTPFIKRSDNLVFNDGMLTRSEGSRPSVVLGFLQLPRKVVSAILPLPLELKNTQITNIKAARTLEELRSADSDAGRR